MKKGFTLVELLGVIVLLAVVALVAAPIVLNVIENSQEEAAMIDMDNLKKSAELFYLNEMSTNQVFRDTTFTCNGTSCSNGISFLEIDGEVPENGKITIDSEGNITTNSVVVNNYYCAESLDGYDCVKVEKTDIESANNLILDNNKVPSLVNYRIYGNSVQNGTPSLDNPVEIISLGDSPKNLFNVNNINSSNYTITENVVSVNINSGVFAVSTETTLKDLCPKMVAGKEYIISFSKSLGNADIYINGKIWSTYESRVITEEDLNSVVKFAGGSLNEDRTVIFQNIQIEEGNIATFYEPYEEDGYKISIETNGKNLFDKSKISLINNIWWNGKITWGYGGYHCSNLIKVSPGETYSMSGKTVTTQNYVSLFDENKKFINQVVWGMSSNLTIPDGVYYIGVSVHHNDLNTFQVEKGTTATAYEEYTGNTYNIILDEPLRKVGNVADYIDFERGIVVRNIGRSLYDGSQEWVEYPQGNGYLAKNLKFINGEPVMSNLLVNSQSLVQTLAIRKTYDYVYLYGMINIYPTADEFRAFLTTTNMEVIGKLVTPTEEKIDLPIIEVNNKTKSIVVNSSINPSNIQINYYKEA